MTFTLTSYGSYNHDDCAKFAECLEECGYEVSEGPTLNSANRIYVEFPESSLHDVSSEFEEFFCASDSDYQVHGPGYRTFDGRSHLVEYLRCAENGDWHRYTELRKCPNSGDMIHCDFWYDRYFECDCCGSTDDTENQFYSERHDQTYCESCYHDSHSRGVQYFEGPSKSFDGANSYGSSRSFGIELETQGGYCSESYAFDGTDDGSIDGTEYVSHVLRGDAGFKELKDFMASGEGIEIDDSCGVHVHVNCSDLNDEELYAVYAAYVVSEDYFKSRVDSCRDDYTYCLDCPSDQFARIREAKLAGQGFRDFAYFLDRYLWINASAYGKHKTLENRMHHGSWDYSELSAWLKLNLRFVRAARYLRLTRRDTVESFKAKVAVALQWAASGSLESPYTARPAQAAQTAQCA